MRIVTRPVDVAIPRHGVALAESVHAPNFLMPMRADPFHKILYVTGGRVVCRRPGMRGTLCGPGTLFMVEAGTAHQMRDEVPAVLLLLCLAPRFVNADPERRALWRLLEQDKFWHLPGSKTSVRQFEGLWRRGLHEQAAPQAGSTVALHASTNQILVTLARLPTNTPQGDTAANRVNAVARELAESFYDEWSLDRAAERAGLSRRRFSELYRRQTGRTFLDALTEFRLHHATELLRAGRHSVAGVAFSCGYRDVSHFYRAFRERYGCAPGSWGS